MTRSDRAFFQQGRGVAAALLLCGLTACNAAPEHKAHPALWAVRDADTTLYLLGTMHALPVGSDWDDGVVGGAVAASDALVMELAPGELAKAGQEFERLAPRAAPLAMDRRLKGEALTNYRRFADDGAIDGARLDDWAITVLMGQRAAQKAGMIGSNGVEAGLTTRFRRASKPISGLETARQQMMIFETLDPGAQHALLTLTANQAGDAVAEIGTLTKAWSRGDVKALEALINEDIDAIPAVKKDILTERNARWAAWAKQRMDRPGTVMVAVGAGHLVGADGVPALLAAQGLRVERLQ